jgi:hypothetical protein
MNRDRVHQILAAERAFWGRNLEDASYASEASARGIPPPEAREMSMDPGPSEPRRFHLGPD